MSERYARGGYEQTTGGGIILALVSFLAAVLVIGGLVYAAGASARHKAALAAAGCEPNLSPSGLQCTTVGMLASQYMALTTPTFQQLNTDMAAYSASEGSDLAGAEAALTAAVTTEKAFGANLAQFPFPPIVAPLAQALIGDNQFRAQLTAEQARASSLAQMESFDERVKAANAAVLTEITLVSKALTLRPTADQEP